MYWLFEIKISLLHPDSKVHEVEWGPSGAGKTQMGPMFAPWNLLSGLLPITMIDNLKPSTAHSVVPGDITIRIKKCKRLKDLTRYQRQHIDIRWPKLMKLTSFRDWYRAIWVGCCHYVCTMVLVYALLIWRCESNIVVAAVVVVLIIIIIIIVISISINIIIIIIAIFIIVICPNYSHLVLRKKY